MLVSQYRSSVFTVHTFVSEAVSAVSASPVARVSAGARLESTADPYTEGKLAPCGQVSFRGK